MGRAFKPPLAQGESLHKMQALESSESQRAGDGDQDGEAIMLYLAPIGSCHKTRRSAGR